ncbi:MAG: PEPxxWA-CTERM sorting domain-containing protein [Sandarakinorhabdus sp.]|jgi:hypothetical protein|nr:PEPxxWA-CTERM sorting domain-containing protein [Sandarakinorhabdus sp.]
MRKISMLLAAAGMAIAAPALAAFSVKVGAPVLAIPGNNDFQGNLATEGLTFYTADGATVTLSTGSDLTFEFMGSESGNRDSFRAAGNTITFSENSGFTGWGVNASDTAFYSAGAISDWFFDSVGGVSNAQIGDTAFGIFLPQGFSAGDTFRTRVLYLGFDDQPSNADDNHDDFIVRVTVGGFNPGGVPEPGTWAMLIAGFGMVGAARRRRRAVVAA